MTPKEWFAIEIELLNTAKRLVKHHEDVLWAAMKQAQSTCQHEWRAAGSAGFGYNECKLCGLDDY